jgi:spore coat polysaccharide biosynthesis protein SpsF (cytidylyltransferase family)
MENMYFMRPYLLVFALSLLFASCLHTRSSAAAAVTVKAGVKIFQGSASLKINGRINENVYSTYLFDTRIRDVNYYDNPLITEGTVSKNETKLLHTGEEYTFSVLPSEVVTINIVSTDENDVIIIVSQYGKEREYTVKGTDKLGLFISFQSR